MSSVWSTSEWPSDQFRQVTPTVRGGTGPGGREGHRKTVAEEGTEKIPKSQYQGQQGSTKPLRQQEPEILYHHVLRSAGKIGNEAMLRRPFIRAGQGILMKSLKISDTL